MTAHNTKEDWVFAQFARLNYQGTAKRICDFYDELGELHVVIEMHSEGFMGTYYLDWIGGLCFAQEPDEFTKNPVPAETTWRTLEEKWSC